MFTPRSIRFAALVDLENTVIVSGCLLAAAQRHVLLGSLDTHVAGMQVRVASGRRVMSACTAELAGRGWGRTLVPTEPDAADRALLEAGHHFTSTGVTDIVVVSGDRAFVALADAARLHVFAHRHRLSRALRLAATTVTHFPDLVVPTLATA
jgi:hypothetical protein